ncbi:MAG: arsenate reductase (glutaredoxin) [Pseudomonadaceae bacterium]|nr:arsenate reductase (glutaredoxin) [Pseudomonadaceae bacterium]
MPFVYYHNSGCSKSRQALQLLEDKGIKPAIREYLKNPLTTVELTNLLTQLGKNPTELIRKGEAIYSELELGKPGVSDTKLIQAMVDHPILIERPILSNGQQARIGRPPEQVLEII